ncbi:MAG: CRTAC1 family protein [Planctomycetes bacterium]|nr:CRTAC1 family protein [Planctomycetota bacterium]
MKPTRRRRALAGAAFTLAAAGLLVGLALVAGPPPRGPAVPSSAGGAEGVSSRLGRRLPPDHPRVRFVDATDEAGISFVHSSGERRRLLPEDMGAGAAWGDYDGDGDPDLVLFGDADAPAPGQALYRNDGDRFTDVTAQAGLDAPGHGMGALFVDYDGDGDLDLHLTRYGPDLLYRNEGDGRFREVASEAGIAAGGWSTEAAWGDVDGDLDLDLYVCRYVDFRADPARAGSASVQSGVQVPWALNPYAFDPLPNRLYLQGPAGRFEDASDRLAAAPEAQGRSLSAVLADLDGDLDLDIYVANDLSQNLLYRNEGGLLLEVSPETYTADFRGAMGIALADPDRDGDADFVLTHWIAQENGFFRNVSPRDAAGRLLSLEFRDAADELGLGQVSLDDVGWRACFVDVDLDGLEDLVVANGSTLERESDVRRLVSQRARLYWQRSVDEGYYDLGPEAGEPFGRDLDARGLAAADYDRDGDVDLVLTQNRGAALLLRNEGGSGHGWVAVEVEADPPNTGAVGARVQLAAGGVTSTRWILCGGSYLSGSEGGRLVFGLGGAPGAERLEVRLAGYETAVHAEVRAGETVQVRLRRP